jgi:hypothetical protein
VTGTPGPLRGSGPGAGCRPQNTTTEEETDSVAHEGFDVDTETVREAAGFLRVLGGDFAEIADYAQEADPDWWMWGGTGVMMAQQYEAAAGQIRIILGKFDPAVQGIAQRIEDICTAYEDTDGQAADDVCGAGEGTTYV